MKNISQIVKELNLVNYKFDEKNNIINAGLNNVYQMIELVNINMELDKNNIKFKVDKNNNICLNIIDQN